MMLRFLQKSDKAIIKTGDLDPGKWWGLSVLNTGVVTLGGTVYLYFRGPVGTDDNTHAIGCMTQSADGFDPFNFSRWTDRGIVIAPDAIAGVTGTMKRLTDCCATVFGGKIWLHFNIKDGGAFRIHAASSTNGTTFTDEGDCTASGATFGGGGAGLVDVDGTLWAVHASAFTGNDSQISTRKSADGKTFTNYVANVIVPDGSNFWFGKSLGTPRLVYEDPYIYAYICGSPTFSDYHEAVGLYRAHKSDSSVWTAYGANPVYLRSAAGTQSEAAQWSFTVADISGRRYAFYEATGSREAGNTTNSNGARDTQYYGYNVSAFSQIFAASTDIRTYASIWSDGDLLPTGNYLVRNMRTLGYLAPLQGNLANLTRMATYSDRSATGAVWAFARLDGFYGATIAGKVLETQKVSRAANEYVGIFTLGGGTHFQQDWHMFPVNRATGGYGLFAIINRNSGMALGVSPSAIGDGAMVQQRAWDGSSSQIWQIGRVL